MKGRGNSSMSGKIDVQVRIVSRADGLETVTIVKAQRYDKSDSVYIRYAEPDEAMGRTVTTVKLERERIRIVRHGDAESEMTFERSGRRPGSYRTPHGTMELETESRKLNVRLEGERTEAEWEYDLYAGGERVGRFELRLSAEPLV
jgi:uncharacterized beta-barrel protein YwiB (DUF1934 family)